MRAWEIPGLGPIGKFISAQGNESGFFDTDAYSNLAIKGVIEPCAATLPPEAWALMLHDSAPTHKGQARAKGAVGDLHYHHDKAGKPMALRDWLKDRRVAELAAAEKSAMRHPEFEEATSEYPRSGGVWDSSTVFPSRPD